MRSEASQTLLEKIASSGAGIGCQYGLQVSPCPELDELIAKGYVCPMKLLERIDHGLFTLTQAARSFIKPCIELWDSKPILQCKRINTEDHISKYTLAELILYLGSHGWKDKESKKTKKLEPYKQDGPRVWYQSPGHKTSKLYLQALAVADERFEGHMMTETVHFQPQAYYRCVVEGCCNVLPNQPLSYYKMLLKGHGSDKQTEVQGNAQGNQFGGLLEDTCPMALCSMVLEHFQYSEYSGPQSCCCSYWLPWFCWRITMLPLPRSAKY